MYKCPYCDKNTFEVKCLITYLKLMHAALHFAFIYKQENCVRSFINLHSFERHLILKHFKQNDDVFVVFEWHLSYDNVSEIIEPDDYKAN